MEEKLSTIILSVLVLIAIAGGIYFFTTGPNSPTVASGQSRDLADAHIMENKQKMKDNQQMSNDTNQVETTNTEYMENQTKELNAKDDMNQTTTNLEAAPNTESDDQQDMPQQSEQLEGMNVAIPNMVKSAAENWIRDNSEPYQMNGNNLQYINGRQADENTYRVIYKYNTDPITKIRQDQSFEITTHLVIVEVENGEATRGQTVGVTDDEKLQQLMGQ